MGCVLPLSYANHTFSVAISSTGFLLQSTVSFLFPSVWASSASNVNFKWTMIHIPDGWTSKSIWWIFWWRVIYNFCLRSMVKLSMLRTLYQDFKVSTDVPWLHWPMQVDTFCLSLFKCGIRGFDFWYLWMSLFRTGGLLNVFFHSKFVCSFKIQDETVQDGSVSNLKQNPWRRSKK